MAKLPSTSFAEIAVNLRCAASSAAMSAELAQAAPWAQGPGTQAEIAALAEDARIAGELSMLFAELVPHEEIVRDFFTGLLDGAAVASARPERKQA